MTFKIQVAGLHGSEIFHWRPIKPWSHWDTAVTVAYFGASAAMMVTLGVDMFGGALSVPLDQVPASQAFQVATALAVTNFAYQWGKQAFSRMRTSITITSDAIEKLPQIINPELQAIKEKLEKVLRARGDTRTIRFVDKAEMEKILGYKDEIETPAACTNPTFSKKHICIGVNPAFTYSDDAVMQYGAAAHEVAHQYKSGQIYLASHTLSRVNNVLVAGALIQSVLLLNPVTFGLAVTSAFIVPALLQEYQRRQEFRSDRGGAFMTGDAEIIRDALKNMESQAARPSPFLVSQPKDGAALTWKDKASNAMWRSVEKTLGVLMDTHPLTERRIRALDVLAKQQAHQRHNLG